MKSSLLYSAALTCFAAFSVCAAAAQAQPTDITSTVDLDADAVFEVREETYTLPDAKLPSAPDLPPAFALKAEMVGLVVWPVNATGPRPVALFIHGQASTCYDPTTGELPGAWPCPDGMQAVPSYRGFLAYQRFLAARGWVTLSISGNGISGNIAAQGDQTDTVLRSELAEAHLQQWALWLAGDTTQTAPGFITAGVQPDLQQLLLVGHSRGGSAANQVATKSLANAALPWEVRALVLIGPVALQINPVATLPTVVLLPGCDGDVLNLQGQSYIDRGRDLADNSALRSSVFIHGANHNFFNSEWDPATSTVVAASSDDASKLFEDRAPVGPCQPGAPERLSGEAQRELGGYYIAAAGKAFVEGETDIWPLFDGSPVCAGPTCSANIQTHALGGGRQPLLIPNAGSALTASDQVSISGCLTTAQAGAESACITADMPTIQTLTRTPHFIPALAGDAPQDPSLVALRMQWSAAAGGAQIAVTDPDLSSEATHIAVRVIVDPDAVGTEFALSLIDSAGTSLPLGAATLNGLPTNNAGAGTGVYWAQEVRFPIDVEAAAADGFDVNAVQSVEITPQSSSGLLWVLDMWSYIPDEEPSTPEDGSDARATVAARR